MKQPVQDITKVLSDPNFSKLFKTVSDTVKSEINQEAEKPQSKSTLKKLGEAGIKIAKAAAPSLVSLIPGIGPIASQLLTTLNDDEWFSEFVGNGATFNEWLKVYVEKVNETGIKIPAAYAGYVEVPTALNQDVKFWDDYMPTILAYVREKTNNVLVDDVDKYRLAFTSASKLLAIYYHGAKLVELSANQPLNIPDLPSRINVISPANYASFAGTIKALGEFIKSTIRLPYAWTEYLRWRYGTIFESENTGKPALISYSYWDDPTKVDVDGTATITFTLSAMSELAKWTELINACKTVYISAGRAGSDLKLAYNDHDMRLTVEPRHYDEKEFNLRCNFTSGVNNGWAYRNNGNTILLDSRLDMNAAIQAVTISTVGIIPGSSTVIKPPFITSAPIIHFYMDSESRLNYANYILNTLKLGAQFVRYSPGWNYLIWRQDYNEVLGFTADYTESYGEGGNTGILAYIHDQLAAALAASAQLHNRPNFSMTGNVTDDNSYCAIAITPLSYDIATVSGDTINNLHRAAMRNLIRGTYKRKLADGAKQEIKDEVKEVSKVVTDLVKE